MNNFKVDKLIAATYVVDNSSDADRAFAISAEVNVSNGSVKNIQNGKVEGPGNTPQHHATPKTLIFNL